MLIISDIIIRNPLITKIYLKDEKEEFCVVCVNTSSMAKPSIAATFITMNTKENAVLLVSLSVYLLVAILVTGSPKAAPMGKKTRTQKIRRIGSNDTASSTTPIPNVTDAMISLIRTPSLSTLVPATIPHTVILAPIPPYNKPAFVSENPNSLDKNKGRMIISEKYR